MPQSTRISVTPLAQVPESHALIQGWFEREWPDYYGPNGPGDACADLARYANWGSLPMGMVALLDGSPHGFAALKTEPFAHFTHWGPWLGAACVEPGFRRQGLGAALVRALPGAAHQLGYSSVYCATATAGSLMRRSGWQRIAWVDHEGHPAEIFQITL